MMMAINYAEMTEEQINLINEYCENDMKKLKQICYIVWGKKGLPSCYYDDLYDDAINVLSESVVSFNPDENTQFKTYLISNIRRSYKDWYRDTHFRAKRNNLELDENGKIKKDENGNPIIIRNLSFDIPDEDGIDLCEKVSSDFKVENGIEEFTYTYINDIVEYCSLEMREYIYEILSNLQRKVLELLMNDYSKEKIMETLKIDSALYSDSIAAITSNKNTRNLRKALEEKKNVR